MSRRNQLKDPGVEEAAELEPLQEKSKCHKPRDNPEPMAGQVACENFDDILEIIGSKGKFQKIFLYLILCPIIAIEPFVALGFIFMFYDPDHWCYQPGWEAGNETLEAWKSRMLPIEDGPNGLPRYSQCKIYDENQTIIDCQYGWVYDKSDYENTLATEFNWVCGNSHFATTVFTAGGVGHVLGNIVFGQAADKYGRKPIFFISLFFQQVVRFVGLFFVHQFTVFVIFQLIASAGFPLMYLLPSLLMAELCDNDFRSWSYSLGWAVWVAGMAALPYIAYLSRRWFLFAMVTSVPGFLVFFYWPYIPESPRWLTSVGRTAEAAKIIRHVAKVNGTSDQLPDDKLESMLKRLVEIQNQDKKENTSVGFWTLLSTWRLAKNTLLLTLSLTMNSIIYESITLNTPNMSGSQFMNFFFLAVIEVPSTWLGGYLLGTLGRRWTQVLFFLFCGMACTTAAIGSSNPDLSWMVLTSIVLAKFGITLTFLVVYLQAAEIFPTPLRTTGNAFASTVNGTISIAAPLLVYLAKIYAGAPYIAMGIFSLTGMIASAFLPETLHQLLPETLEDAKNFGKGTAFWSFRPMKPGHSPKVEEGIPIKSHPNCVEDSSL